MGQLPHHLTPAHWKAPFLSSGAARKGRVVKRQIRDVARVVGREAALAAIARRGVQVPETGHRVVVFCNDVPIRRVRPTRPPPDVCPARSAVDPAL